MIYKAYLESWLNGYCESSLKPTTIEGYKRHSKNYIIPYLGQYELTDLTTYQIQLWIYELQKKGRKNSEKPLNSKTVIQAYRILSRSLKSAVKMQLLTVNPCFGVELPRKKKCSYIWLSSAVDIDRFVNAFSGTDYYLPVLMAISLGLRRSELLALRWSDIDFKAAVLHVVRSVVIDSNRQVVIDDLKNASSFRSVLIPSFLLAILASMPHDHGYIFCRSDGSLINPSSFSKRYCELREAFCLPHIRFHDLRHSHASYLFSQGVEPRIIQDRLGHSNISTTMDIYTHTDVLLQSAAISLIDDIFMSHI